MNKVKVWFINRLKEKSTWLGIIALASIFGYGGFDHASSDQIASSIALVISTLLVSHKEQK